ncbi:MAG: serine hydrolase domain-containing protein [Acidimicrobiales bacterium]
MDRHGPVLRAWGGNSCVVGDTIPTSYDTLYDLASLTKVVATTTLAMWLVQNHRWKLTDKVSSWLPGFARDDITLWHLITHTSGLVAHRPFFQLGQDPRAIRRAVYAEALRDDAPGHVLYSDLNFMLLGWAVEHCTGTPLHSLFRDTVASPLQMTATRYRPSTRDQMKIAATELDGDQRLAPVLVWGEVHDGNAWALKGVAGHAGLFAPAKDMARFVSALLDSKHHPVLKQSTITTMTKFQAGAQPDVRAMGWRLQPQGWGKWPDGTFWHTGFTGTSLLLAPQEDLGVVLLMNAVHPVRQMDRQAAFRARIHRAIAKGLA